MKLIDSCHQHRATAGQSYPFLLNENELQLCYWSQCGPHMSVYRGQLMLNSTCLLECEFFLFCRGRLHDEKLAAMLTHHALMTKLFSMKGWLTLCRLRGSWACWIKYKCPGHNAKLLATPDKSDKSVSVLRRQLCEESHCPLSFGAAEDSQTSRRLGFQHGRNWERQTPNVCSPDEKLMNF